jgi:glycosyltransferase involved in cell wall biosynthesis
VLSIPTGIDTNTFRPPSARERTAARNAVGADPGTLVVGIVATLRSWKGHRYLIEGFADAWARSTAADAQSKKPPAMRLVIVGDGPQRDALEALVDSLGIRAQVRFGGNQPNVIPWLHAMDLFALPSYANEGVPQAILQAMACGVPVITTDAGAIGEVAYDTGEHPTACVVRKEHAGDLRDAIVALRDDPPRRERIARNALGVVREHHGIDGMLDRMETVFRAAVGRP